MNLSDAERAAGLTQPLPAGETLLWQGKPDPRELTRTVFRLRAVTWYCAAVALAILVAGIVAGRPVGQAVALATLILPVALVAIGLLRLVGWATARATTYTLTSRRVILHIGVAYEMTVSIPLSAITDARLRRGRGDHGEIALAVKDDGGTSYIALWPHARFGRFIKPQPMLRGIDDVDAVRDTLADALVMFNAGGRVRRVAPIETPAALPHRAVAA